MSNPNDPRKPPERPFFDDSEPDATAVTLPPFVEVEFVYEDGSAGVSSQKWRSLELWTRNRIYAVDWSMKCIEVIDRESGKPDPSHSLLGTYLTGGQKKSPNGELELTYPCPRPGTEAVFENRARKGAFAQTSTVERVVLRLRILTVKPERAAPAWEELSAVASATARNIVVKP